MARVDVIVPCYNYGDLLEACVASVLSQQEVDVVPAALRVGRAELDLGGESGHESGNDSFHLAAVPGVVKRSLKEITQRARAGDSSRHQEFYFFNSGLLCFRPQQCDLLGDVPTAGLPCAVTGSKRCRCRESG